MREIRLSGSEGGVRQSNAPSLPLSVAAWPPSWWFRVWVSSVAEVADPGRGSERFSAHFFGMRFTGFVLADEDVSAPGPIVETGAAVPCDSGGFAAWLVVSDAGFFFCSRGR